MNELPVLRCELFNINMHVNQGNSSLYTDNADLSKKQSMTEDYIHTFLDNNESKNKESNENKNENSNVTTKKNKIRKITINYVKNSKEITLEITNKTTISKIDNYFGKSSLIKSEIQYRGIPFYFINFNNGYAIGLYKDLPYCYIASNVKWNCDDYFLEGSDFKGYSANKKGYKLIIELLSKNK